MALYVEREASPPPTICEITEPADGFTVATETDYRVRVNSDGQTASLLSIASDKPDKTHIAPLTDFTKINNHGREISIDMWARCYNGNSYIESAHIRVHVDDDAPPVPTCSDGIQNGNETGVDCGGDCPPCNELVDFSNHKYHITDQQLIFKLSNGTEIRVNHP